VNAVTGSKAIREATYIRCSGCLSGQVMLRARERASQAMRIGSLSTLEKNAFSHCDWYTVIRGQSGLQ
jgi:hypothetical protein